METAVCRERFYTCVGGTSKLLDGTIVESSLEEVGVTTDIAIQSVAVRSIILDKMQ